MSSSTTYTKSSSLSSSQRAAPVLSRNPVSTARRGQLGVEVQGGSASPRRGRRRGRGRSRRAAGSSRSNGVPTGVPTTRNTTPAKQCAVGGSVRHDTMSPRTGQPSSSTARCRRAKKLVEERLLGRGPSRLAAPSRLAFARGVARRDSATWSKSSSVAASPQHPSTTSSCAAGAGRVEPSRARRRRRTSAWRRCGRAPRRCRRWSRRRGGARVARAGSGSR